MNPSCPRMPKLSRSMWAAMASPPKPMDFADDLLQGKRCRPDEEPLAQPLHFIVFVDDGLAAENVLVVFPGQVPVDEVLQGVQILQLVKEREDVHLFAARDLHAGRTVSPVPSAHLMTY